MHKQNILLCLLDAYSDVHGDAHSALLFLLDAHSDFVITAASPTVESQVVFVYFHYKCVYNHSVTSLLRYVVPLVTARKLDY